jgi:hypothetical protein
MSIDRSDGKVGLPIKYSKVPHLSCKCLSTRSAFKKLKTGT